MDNIFTGVTLFITHYNRSNSLGRLLKSFKQLDCFFEDIVVSDDGSSVANQENLIQLQLEFPFRIIGTLNNTNAWIILKDIAPCLIQLTVCVLWMVLK